MTAAVAQIGSNLAHALAYARRGWPVFPLHTPVGPGACSCEKQGCGNVGKHPRTRHGLKDATTDADQIKAWWRQWPDANIGLITGSASGIVIVDVDPRSEGDETWKWLVDANECPLTVRSDTGRGDGGFHLLFECKDVIKSSAGALGKGVDVKGEGGYVVAPPSLHEAGGRYAFSPTLAPKEQPLAPLPAWIRQCLRDKKTPASTRPPATMPAGVGNVGGDGWLYTAFAAAGWITGKTPTGFVQVRCPWESEHTSHTPSATVIFPPSPGRAMGWFECKHAHCAHRTLDDIRAALPAHAVESANRAYPPVKQRLPVYEPAHDTEQLDESETVDNGPMSIRRPVLASSSRRMIEVTLEREHVTNQAIEALATRGDIFQRNGELVQVVMNSVSPIIRSIPKDWVLEKLGVVADWKKMVRDSLTDITPPKWVADYVFARGKWDSFPHLLGVTESPIIRSDGSILDTAGYDEATRLWYQPNAEYPEVPVVPTRAVAQESLAKLLDLVVDFPFETPEHRSAWLAALLTPFARWAFDGPAPLFLIDANNKGTGKGKLCDVIAKIATGRDFARCPQATDAEEERKRITTWAMEGDRMVLFDDITQLGGKALDAALTATVWKDRKLGSSASTGDIPININWYATGNNVQIREDASRRVLHIRLETPLERPEERTGFHHENLLKFVGQNRAKFAVDCLTILRSYFLDGAPQANIPPWGSFEGWSDLIRGCIVWLGLPDPGEVRKALREDSDSTSESIGEFLQGWHEASMGAPMSANDMAAKLRDADYRSYSLLRDAINGLRPAKNINNNLTAQELAVILRRVRGRVINGYKIERHRTSTYRGWFTVKVEAK